MGDFTGSKRFTSIMAVVLFQTLTTLSQSLSLGNRHWAQYNDGWKREDGCYAKYFVVLKKLGNVFRHSCVDL